MRSSGKKLGVQTTCIQHELDILQALGYIEKTGKHRGLKILKEDK